MSGPQTPQTQNTQIKTQNPNNQTQIMQKILEKINDELLKRFYNEKDLENLTAAKLWGLKPYGSRSEGILEQIVQNGWTSKDIEVDMVWYHSGDDEAYDVTLILPNGSKHKITVIPKKPRSTLTKEEYEKVKKEVMKLKEKMRVEELESKVRELQKDLELYKNEKASLEEKLARLEEERRELNSMIEEMREFVIYLEKEEEFVEWLARKKYQENLEQLKEEIKDRFFPNTYDC